MAAAVYYLCLIGVLPAAIWALWVAAVSTVASQPDTVSTFRLAWRAFLALGTPYFMVVVLMLAAGAAAWIGAGILPSTRGYGHLATAILGFAAVGYAVMAMPRQEPASYILLLPSLAAAIASAAAGVQRFL